jgi:flagellar hook-basal body complex protein FliE
MIPVEFPVERMTSTPGSIVAASDQANSGAPGAVPFSSLLKSMVEQSKALDTQATSTVAGLLNGQGVEIHDAMIATQKASLAFELALQVRNKAVAAYQQMSGMQF